MKITKILLRWYKSFNVCYRFETPAKNEVERHPWNAINVGRELASDYPFIEIPVEKDITTVVGGNESGKSHLLNAISKVINGSGVEGEPFTQTDFCRYATVPSLSTARWPNIGLQFQVEDSDKLQPLFEISGLSSIDRPKLVTLVLGKEEEVDAYLYFDSNEQAHKLKAEALELLRKALPIVRFINAKAALPDNLRLNELLAGCGFEEDRSDFRISNSAARKIIGSILRLNVPPVNQAVGTLSTEIDNIKKEINDNREDVSRDAKLAAQLFTEVLGIPPETLKEVLGQPPSQRGFIQYYLDNWNDRVFERLDLAHFWQQDDQATLELVYKDDTLYFDITDKTGATYTFKERSSGLRYFLSYYIQAKALELAGKNSNSVIVMDEPDSFLSIIGQRNMLSVFESLVGFERARGTSQVVYTTHSPFLINRNFPRRIRVVNKEEAEEGTQFSGRGASRRYEPVRSALGIDCAQTLFMGASNLVLEGLTDQFLLVEANRMLSNYLEQQQILDLNNIVFVSADGVFNVEKILSASQWSDEPIPATTVLLDGDDAGKTVAQNISGNAEGKKKLIERDFVILLDKNIDASINPVSETIEDLIPFDIYSSSFIEYVAHWYPFVFESAAGKLRDLVAKSNASLPNVARIKQICIAVEGLDEDYDKLGVLQFVIDGVDNQLASGLAHTDSVKLFLSRLLAVYKTINETVELSRRSAVKRSMTTNTKRIIREFLRTRIEGCLIIELKRHVHRLMKEALSVGEAGDNLRAVLEKMDSECLQLEQQGQSRIIGDSWQDWIKWFEGIKRDPLKVTSDIFAKPVISPPAS